jgi:hypothetical protein
MVSSGSRVAVVAVPAPGFPSFYARSSTASSASPPNKPRQDDNLIVRLEPGNTDIMANLDKLALAGGKTLDTFIESQMIRDKERESTMVSLEASAITTPGMLSKLTDRRDSMDSRSGDLDFRLAAVEAKPLCGEETRAELLAQFYELESFGG